MKIRGVHKTLRTQSGSEEFFYSAKTCREHVGGGGESIGLTDKQFFLEVQSKCSYNSDIKNFKYSFWLIDWLIDWLIGVTRFLKPERFIISLFIDSIISNKNCYQLLKIFKTRNSIEIGLGLELIISGSWCPKLKKNTLKLLWSLVIECDKIVYFKL